MRRISLISFGWAKKESKNNENRCSKKEGNMTKSKKPQSRGYIGKFLKTADKAIVQGIKDADKAIHEGIKKADESLDTGIELGIISTKQARIEAKKLRKQAEKEAILFQKNAEKEVQRIRKQSEKVIKKRIRKIRQSNSRAENLRILEKLGKLKKAGVITEREFQQKKKELLREI